MNAAEMASSSSSARPIGNVNATATQSYGNNSKKTSVSSNGSSKSKFAADAFGKEKERREPERLKASKVALKMALKLKEIESKRPSFNAVIAPASDITQGLRGDTYGAGPPQRIETVTDRRAPREVTTGFNKHDNNHATSSSSLSGSRYSLKDAGSLNTSIYSSSSSSSRLPQKNPHLQEQFKASRKEKADKIKALETQKEQTALPRTVEHVDIRELEYSMPNNVVNIQKGNQVNADKIMADVAKENADFLKATENAKINQQLKKLKSSSSNDVVMIQKFGSLNEEAYTKISPLWGSNRSLFERWRLSKTIPGLFWEYVLSADDFKNKGFSININKSNFDKIQVFDLDPVDKDSTGAALLRHIVDPSYAVFCGQTPLAAVDVVMIVNSESLAGMSIREQLQSMGVISDAAYHLVAFSSNSLFTPKLVPEPLIVPTIIPKQTSAPLAGIRGSGSYTDPQNMVRAPAQYRVDIAQPLQNTGVSCNANYVEHSNQMPRMQHNIQPNNQMPGMQHNIQPQHQMPGMPHRAEYLGFVPQMAGPSTYPETTAQYLSSVSNRFSNSMSAENFQSSLKLAPCIAVDSNVRPSPGKIVKGKKKDKEKRREKEKGQDKEKEKERGRENGRKRPEYASGEGRKESRDFRGGEKSFVADRLVTGKDRGAVSSNYQQDHAPTSSRSEIDPRDFIRSHSHSRDIREKDRDMDRVNERSSKSTNHGEHASRRRASDPSVSTSIPMSVDIGIVYTGDDNVMPLAASALDGPKKRRLADVEDTEDVGHVNPCQSTKYSNGVQIDKDSRKGGSNSHNSAVGAKSSSSNNKVVSGVNKHPGICRFFTRGTCNKGDKCPWEHVDPKVGPRTGTGTGTVPMGASHHVEQISNNYYQNNNETTRFQSYAGKR